MMRITFCALSFCLSAGAAFGATHVHRVYGLNTETAPDCEILIDAIAGKIQQEQAVSIVASFCETSTSTDRTTGVISYDAYEPLKEVSTYTFASTYSPRGIYSTRENCEGALGLEIQEFEAQTGLAKTYAFCARESLRSRDAWYPHITGFGYARKMPHRSSWHSDRPHDLDNEAILGGLNRHFSGRDATFVHVTYHHTGASGQITAFYYAPADQSRLEIHSSTVATIPGLNVCSDTAIRIGQDAIVVGEKPAVLSYCSSGYSNPTRFELVILHEGLTFLDSIKDSREFSSLAACESARPSIEREMRSVHGDKLVTTVCGHPRFSLTSGAPFYVIAARHY